MNETQFRYCDISGKTVIIKNKSKHIKSESHKHKKHLVLSLQNLILIDQTIIK